jgi:hypothetical protein
LRATALLSPLVLALGLDHFGLLGAAWGVGIARVLPPLLVTVYAWRALGLDFPVLFLGRVALASLAFALPLHLLLGPAPTGAGNAPNVAAILPLLGYAGLGAVAFLVVFRALGGLDRDDRRRLLELRLPFRDLLARCI